MNDEPVDPLTSDTEVQHPRRRRTKAVTIETTSETRQPPIPITLMELSLRHQPSIRRNLHRR